MRSILLALAASVVLTVRAGAADLRNFEDAALNDVQFVDRNEGWAAGDDGVVWHTIDGGRTWERQPTGVRGSLRSIHFLNPYTGWVVGREVLPHGGGSTGVLLVTRDGGLKWRRVCSNLLPGLQRVRFFDDRTGLVTGDGTDQCPTGVFLTRDAGKSWKPIPGPRGTAWLAADFQDPQTGALAGAWGRLATLRDGTITTADAEVDRFGGRTIHSLQIIGQRAVAVGQGGLVLLSSDSAGQRWGYANLQLPPEVLACCDFHAVQCRGEHVWVAGRPGSMLLHSPDRGKTWEVRATGQPLPLHGLCFTDEQYGWAVGELGTVLATVDGGKSWTLQRQGGQRAAALFIHARAGALPLESVALVGAEDGYLTAALRVTGADPSSASPHRAGEAQAVPAAMRLAGGAAGEALWQFPVPEHLANADQRELLRAWDRLHADHAADQVLRQLVLALRIWRPEVVVTDYPEAQGGGQPVDALVAEAVREAFRRASDPQAFPEQINRLGLKPCQPAKLYGRCPDRGGAQVVHDLTEARPRLQATARDFATPAASLLADGPVVLPAQRFYRLLGTRMDGAAGHRELMEGLALAPNGTARRPLGALPEAVAEIEKAIRVRRNLQGLAETPVNGLSSPDQLLAQIGPMLAGLPDDQAAAAAFAIASQYARTGQWLLARETFLLMVDRYPAHPLAADAYRWLIRYGSSSEARRRQEMGQFLMVTQLQPHQAEARPEPGTVVSGGVETTGEQKLALLGSQAETRRWYQGSLALESRLAAFGPLFATDPAVQFCLQAAHRSLGEFEPAREWYQHFFTQHPSGPWHDAAAAELWLTNRRGPAPRPAALCPPADTRPFLDGNLDDACWQGKPVELRNAVGDTIKEHGTRAWLAYDKEFLYLAVQCRHPEGGRVAPVKVRQRDADLRAYDRVSLLLDLDRDYNTYFRLEVDQRGCVCEDCWGDRSWNPRWFVAVKSDETSWQVEAAIPLIELTGDGVTPGRAWACNVVRILPGKGVQAMSLPADVEPRPEGMGLLLFTQEPQRQAERSAPPQAN